MPNENPKAFHVYEPAPEQGGLDVFPAQESQDAPAPSQKLLSDGEWAAITDKLSGRTGARARGNKSSARSFIEAVMWIASRGAYWRCLPKEYGPNHSVYVRFSRWVRAGRWQAVIEVLPRHDLRRKYLTKLVADHLASLEKKRLYSADTSPDGPDISPPDHIIEAHPDGHPA